jgi:hypothetical protein
MDTMRQVVSGHRNPDHAPAGGQETDLIRPVRQASRDHRAVGTRHRCSNLSSHACLRFSRSGMEVRSSWPFGAGARSNELQVSGRTAAAAPGRSGAAADAGPGGSRAGVTAINW